MDREQRRAHRRDGLEYDLRRHEERRTLLRDKLEHARAVHAAAHRALLEAEAALTRASALYDGAEQDCAELRHLMTFDPDMVDGLPTELLDTVFLTMATEPDPLWPDIDDAVYNGTRDRLPDVLAAVCHRWRAVALANSRLWTYIALPGTFPTLGYQKKAVLEAHIALRLQRSRLSPIDICLAYEEGPATFRTVHMRAYWQGILPLVAAHSERWRRIKIRLPFLCREFEQLVSGTTMPVLEELYILPHMDGGDIEMDASWLSSARALRKLSAGVYFRFSAGPSAVVSARFDVYPVTVDKFLAALNQMPALEALSVHLKLHWGFRPRPRQAISLPALKCLKLRGTAGGFKELLSLSISASQATRLNLALDEIFPSTPDTIQDFLLAFPALCDLELDAGGGRRCWKIPALQSFTHIRTLTFAKCDLPGKFFHWMNSAGDASSGGLLLPQLESLTIRDPGGKDCELPLRALTCFARTRASACCACGQHFSVALESWPSRFPLWFRRALGAALGSSNLRLTSREGILYDGVGHSDEGSDGEAPTSSEDEGFDDKNEDPDAFRVLSEGIS